MNPGNGVSRRKFLQVGLGAAGVAAAAACTPIAPDPTPAPPTPTLPVIPLNERSLVVIEMAGGHDGYSMTIPFQTSAYYTHRPSVSIPAAQVIPIGHSGLGWHPNLARISQRTMTVVQGIGGANPNGSHFEMLRRWWSGDVDGHSPQSTGFFGRLCDVIGDPSAPATGISLGWGTTPALVSARAVTLSMTPYGSARFPSPGGNVRATWLAAQRAMANPDLAESQMMYAARYGAYNALRFSDVVSSLPASQQVYPQTNLGAQLQMTARLLRANIGTRIIYIPFGGSFDSHENHKATHSAIMSEFDGALDAFMSELAALNMTRKVLVATFSEFGRRCDQNSDGLDHGTASAMLMTGGSRGGVYGTPPSWTSLDRDGNLVSTAGIGQYYATLAQWLGVHATDVLPANYAPIPGIIA